MNTPSLIDIIIEYFEIIMETIMDDWNNLEISWELILNQNIWDESVVVIGD